jgi:hypothetical protein
MAVNETRDMRTDLEIGATEGSFKSFFPNLGGEISAETVKDRALMSDVEGGYGFNNIPVDIRPLPTGRWAKQTTARGGAAPR